MSLYLSKKITMKEAEATRCVSMNRKDGFIVVGGLHGFLKVFKLDHDEKSGLEGKQLVTANTLSKEQILKGHKASIECVQWNEKFRKVISGDAEGKIVVWVFVQNQWHEEMCNHSNQSAVSSIRWSPDDFKICIAYEDGEILVGSVDGKRLWAANLKKNISCVEWSSDCRQLLVGTDGSQVLLYDCHGLLLKTLVDFRVRFSKSLVVSPSKKSSSTKHLMADWLRVDQENYKEAWLVVAHEDGVCYLMSANEEVRELQTDLKVLRSVKWLSGEMVAVMGAAMDNHYIRLFNTNNDQMEHSLLLPENKVATSFDWDRGSVRLLITLDVYVYFANHRINYKWCVLRDTIVMHMLRPLTLHSIVIFWNTNRHEVISKGIEGVVGIVGCEDLCCIITTATDAEEEESSKKGYQLLLTNSIAAHLDCKHVEMPLRMYHMSSSHVVVASEAAFYVWQFKNFKEYSTLQMSNKMKGGLEKLLHIDDVASGVGGDNIDWLRSSTPTDDPITCLSVSKKSLVVGRRSGLIHSYKLPNLMLHRKFKCQNSPISLSFNCDASYMAIISDKHELTFLKTSQDDTENDNNNNNLNNNNNNLNNTNNNSMTLDVEKDSCKALDDVKSTWMFLWAKDDPASFALMSSTKAHIYNNFQLEDSFVSSGYLSSFNALKVTLVLLDDLVDLLGREHPGKSQLHDLLFVHKTKSLREVTKVLSGEGYDEAHQFVVNNPHSVLWKMLGDWCLRSLLLEKAEDCYSRAQCLHALKFAKKLSNLQNDRMKKAEIAMFFGDFEQAESIYFSMDRKDLAMSMRSRMGDYSRQAELMEDGGWVSDNDKRDVCNKIADQYYHLQMWPEAIAYYREAGNEAQLMKCYINNEDMDQLYKLTQQLPENHALLPELGRTFEMMGMCPEAVTAYLKHEQVQQAIDACVKLNHWSLAIDIGQTHNRKDVNEMLLKFMEEVKDKPFEAVELYRKANHHLKAAQLLYQLAENLRKSRPSMSDKVVGMKKLYLCCALLLEERQEIAAQKNKKNKKTDQTSFLLEGLLQDDQSADTHVITNAWRCVEAYHFYALALTQYYRGDYESSMLTCLHLRDFDDIITPFNVYSLLALSSLACKLYSVCSNAFMRLESLKELSAEQRKALSDLAVKIFYKNNVGKEELPNIKCINCSAYIPFTSLTCNSCQTRLVVCVASGKTITKPNAWHCSVCKKCAYEKEVSMYSACPLCLQNTVKYLHKSWRREDDDDEDDDRY